MSVFAGKYIYKNYDIMFWKTPKTMKATIWKFNTSILQKRFIVRDTTPDQFITLKKRVIAYLDKISQKV